MVKISGGKAGSVTRLKKEMEKSSGGGVWVRYLKEGEDLTGRFLTEPDEWYAYREHYDPEAGFFPCIGRDNDCPGCNHHSEKVQRASRRYLANFLDTEDGRVVPLKLPLDLANRLVARYERNNNTILNRDYTLHRMGKGLDTTYDVTPEDKSDMDLSRYEMIDPEEVLIAQFEETFDLEPSGEGSAKTSKPSSQKKREQAESLMDEDDDLDEEVPSEPSDSADEGETEGYLTEAQALAMTKDELKDLADQVGAKIDKRWSKEKMVDAIFAEAE